MSDISDEIIKKLVEEIESLKEGLDPEVLASWYSKIQNDAKSMAPPELMDKIEVIQDPILTMKFEFRISRRTLKYVIDAIEMNLPSMPLATRLYFQKVEELIIKESMR